MKQQTVAGMTVLRNRVLLARLQDKVTKGGIHLPDAMERGVEGRKGRVLAVGPGKVEDGILVEVAGVSVGQIVLYDRHSGYDFEHDGEKYTVCSEDGILVVLGVKE